MEKNILVVEGNTRQRLRLVRTISGAAAEANVNVKFYKAVSAFRAEQILQKQDIDMLVLNTDYKAGEAKSQQGFALVEALRKTLKYSLLPVVFVSNCVGMREYAFTELNCLGFQPYDYEEEVLGRILQKGLHNTTGKDEKTEICLKDKQHMHIVGIKDIVYIKGKKRELIFHLANGFVVTVLNKNFCDVNERLNFRCMIQCGRNILINKNYVERLEENTVFLTDGGESIPIHVGERYQKKVKWQLEP